MNINKMKIGQYILVGTQNSYQVCFTKNPEFETGQIVAIDNIKPLQQPICTSISNYDRFTS